jgi:hypothetical protein
MGELLEAVIHWLEYQRCIGTAKFLNESALTIPIVGYLTSEGWEIKKETDYGFVCPGVARGRCYADFTFARNDELLILETKFFKSSARKTIFEDFLRLALPLEPSLSRLALVAFSRAAAPWGPYKELLNIKEQQFVEIDLQNCTLKCSDKTFPLSSNERGFEKLLTYIQQPIGIIKAACARRISYRNYGAMLFAIERA